MKVLLSALAICLAQGAVAQEVGIQFGDMKPGTQLVTQRIDDKVRREETYLGQEGDTYVTELYDIKPDGTRRFIFKTYYDLQGRRLRGERNGQATSYAPFDCRYVVGECSHETSIPYLFEEGNDRFSTNSGAYVNRLEGSTFYYGTVLSNGAVREYPFELGKYNFRVSQAYENALGQKRGFTFVKLVEP